MTPDWVKVGQKVVSLVSADKWGDNGWREYCPNLPVKNGIYTIRSVQIGASCFDGREMVAIRLVEIHNPKIQTLTLGLREPDFDWKGFAPLSERKTDISIFQKMLGPKQLEHA